MGEDIASPGEYETGTRAPSAKSGPVLWPKKPKTQKTTAAVRENLSRSFDSFTASIVGARQWAVTFGQRWGLGYALGQLHRVGPADRLHAWCVVLHEESRTNILDCPRRREVASCHLRIRSKAVGGSQPAALPCPPYVPRGVSTLQRWVSDPPGAVLRGPTLDKHTLSPAPLLPIFAFYR